MLAKLFSTQSYRNMAHEKLKIFNFAFLDLETTGLPLNEYNKTKITELSITVVESNHIRLGVYPRIRNKLNLCFNPLKIVNPIATELTGLANDILENQTYFSQNVVNIINEFLNLQKKPICLVAHNGNNFDYPILQADINKAGGSLNEDILCMDSILCFKDLHNERAKLEQPSSRCYIEDEVPNLENKEFDMLNVKRQKVITGVFSKTQFSDEYDQLLCDAVDEYEKSLKNQNIQKINETTPKKQVISNNSGTRQVRSNATSSWKKNMTSFKLCDIYKRLTCKDPINSHHAEGDVDCLIHCAAAYGDDFVEWADKNAKLFSTIPAMRPDLETTGLPSEENNSTRITELNITVIESKAICSGKCPRVRNKLNLCFNPRKLVQPESTKLTGLSNDILEYQSPFNLDVMNTINHFLNLQKTPVCFVAHYGEKFDYPILKAEMIRAGGTLNENIFCMDSWICFQDLHREKPMPSSSESISTGNLKTFETCDGDTTVKRQRISFKLTDVFKRLTNKEPVEAHQAEADVEYLIECACVYGKKFVDWANKKAKPFSVIPEMKPGVRIGW